MIIPLLDIILHYELIEDIINNLVNDLKQKVLSKFLGHFETLLNLNAFSVFWKLLLNDFKEMINLFFYDDFGEGVVDSYKLNIHQICGNVLMSLKLTLFNQIMRNFIFYFL